MSIKDNFRQAFNEVMQDGKNEQNTEAPAEANDAKTPAAREMSAGQPRKPVALPAAQSQVNERAANDAERTVITRDTLIEGSVKTSSPLFLAGSIHGDIDCASAVTITGAVKGNLKAARLMLDGAEVEGNIAVSESVEIINGSVQAGDLSAKEAVINGAIKGNLQIREALILQKEAYIMGNIRAGFLEITRGAVINGNVANMGDDPEKADQRFSFSRQIKKSSKGDDKE